MSTQKASIRNAWNAVAETTNQVRSGTIDPALTHWVSEQGFTLDETVFSSVCRFDDGIYTGTLVDHKGQVWEFFANLNDLEDCDLDNVTAALGPKSPEHPEHDLCDLVTMAIYFHQQQEIAA